MLATLIAASALAGEPTITAGLSWGYFRQVGLDLNRPSADVHVEWTVASWGPSSVEVGGVLRRHLVSEVEPFPGFDLGATGRYARALKAWSPAIGLEIAVTSAFDINDEVTDGWPGWDEVIVDRLKTSPIVLSLLVDPARFRIPAGKVEIAVQVLGFGLGTTFPAMGRVAAIRIDVLRVGVAL